MRKLLPAFTLALGFAAGPILFGQDQDNDNPFLAHKNNGEIVHVLPTPSRAAQHSAHGPFSFAPPSNGSKVYSASYGSGSLIDHGGPQMSNAGFQPVYWNDNVPPATRAAIRDFVQKFSGSNNWSDQPTDDYTIVQQYGSHDNIAPSIAVATNDVVSNQPGGGTVTDDQIQTFLASLFKDGLTGASENVLYGVYFPTGVTVQLSPGSQSCSQFCGYHGSFDYNGQVIKYAVFPFADCLACSVTGLTSFDIWTIVSSHEIREAVTDPELNAWFDRRGYEGDDKCAWHNLYRMTNGSYVVQPEYSNGGTVNRSGFTATYPGPGCVVPNQTGSGGGGGRGRGGH
jgi:hypothetical protein